MKEKSLEYRDDEKRDIDLLDLKFIERKIQEKEKLAPPPGP